MNDNGAEPPLRRKERSMKIDWIRKLTSRKFWAAIAAFVSMMIVALGNSQETATQVTSLIMAGAAVVAYILGEGLADAAGAADGSDTTEK